MRNKIGDAHGMRPRAVKRKPRHAELAVNLAGTMASFLAATWREAARRVAGSRARSYNVNGSDHFPARKLSLTVVEIGNVAQWAGVVVTTAAIIVALFKEEIIRQFRHPSLTLKNEAKAPYIVKTPITEQQWSGSRYFIRMRICNCGKVRADKVEVFFTALMLRNGSYEPVPNFTAMNLRWSYGNYERPDIYIDGISPKMERLCDLAAISDPAAPSLHPLSDTTTRLSLRLEILPHNTEWLRLGRYKFRVQVVGSNCDPTVYWIDLHLTGLWDNDPNTMMSHGIVLDCRED